MNAAIRVEAIKLRRSLVGTIGTLAVVAGTLALLGGITRAVATGNAELSAKVGPAATLDWNGLLASAAQITSVGGLLAFGIVLAWIFGREFTDGTITGLFALPVSRARIALAKLVVYATWAMAVSLTLAFGVLVLGLGLGYGPPTSDTWTELGRQVAVAILTAVVAIPVAWIATVSRSLLAGVGGAIALVICAQVGALAGAGGWMPVAAPALWAMSAGQDITAAQLAVTVALSALFAVFACFAWDRLQLNR